MKRLLSALALAALCGSAAAQFNTGAVLKASALNAALAAPTVTGGTVDGAPIGATVPAAGTFTALRANNSVKLGANLLVSATAPTVSSGFGTSPSVASSNGTATFRVNVGTGGTASSGVLAMPAAPNGWNCVFRVFNPTATNLLSTNELTASTITSVTVSNLLTSTGALSAWPASTVLVAQCEGY